MPLHQVSYKRKTMSLHYCVNSVAYFIFSIWGVINGLLFNVFILLLAVSHFRATTSDPGMQASIPGDFKAVA